MIRTGHGHTLLCCTSWVAAPTCNTRARVGQTELGSEPSTGKGIPRAAAGLRTWELWGQGSAWTELDEPSSFSCHLVAALSQATQLRSQAGISG